MVSESYLVHKPPPPPTWKWWLNQQAMPLAIDAAGALESAAEQVSLFVRRNPAMTMIMALSIGLVGSGLTRLGHRRARLGRAR